MTYPLSSPGVDVSLIDESFYATSGSGTIPLIIVGTHENKLTPSGDQIAEGTLKENANKLYTITSQRELGLTFGSPIFYTSNGTAKHGYELNEFGLLTAHQYLGIANRVYVIRGDIDYAELIPTNKAPRGNPASGTYWLDTNNTAWGVFESNGGSVPGSAWASKKPIVIDTSNEVEYVVIGSAEFSNASSDVAVHVAGNIVINNQTVTFAANDTLSAVVSKINNAGISNVTASFFQLSGTSRLIIKNTAAGGSVTIGNASTPAILESLGLSGREAAFYSPKTTVGTDGSFAIVVTENNDNELYQKLKAEGITTTNDPLSSSFWFVVGSKEWKAATPTRNTGTTTPNVNALPSQSFKVRIGQDPASDIAISFNSGATNVQAAVDQANEVLANLKTLTADDAGFISSVDPRYVTLMNISFRQNGTSFEIVNRLGTSIYVSSTGTFLTDMGLQSSVKGNELYYAPHYNVPEGSSDGDVWIKTTEYNSGANWIVKIYNIATNAWTTISAPLYESDTVATTRFGSSLGVGTLYVRYNVLGTTLNPIASHEIRRYNGIAWESLIYNFGSSAPTTDPEDGTLWFNDNFRVDIMINDGDQWRGYRNYVGFNGTDPSGPILAGSAPLTQLSGAALVSNDLWIDTSDTENYPKIYRYNAATKVWTKIDNTDNTTPFGIVFADARSNADGTASGAEAISAMLASDYVDPDAPDARLYPNGTLLFNTRYSTNNVKKWDSSYLSATFDGTDYTQVGYNVGASTFGPVASAGRWVTVSGNKENGSPYMGRKAQRAVVVKSLAATISGNEDIRSEFIYFNLLAAPGYVELIDEMISLNTDKKETAFIIGDSPIRLKPTGTAIANWANASKSKAESNSEDGLVSNNPYLGVYYPWGMSTNTDGMEVMVPSSAIALRTLAYNDTVSYPWFAPAGFTRGLVTNASTVGYLTDAGEFQAVILNQGQRDTLQANKLNPIAYIPNRGLTVFGQKTRSATDSAMDRINVARLVNYLRYNFDNMAKSYLFEPNDYHTRDSVRVVFERFLGNLVTLRAVYDFLVVCDESNNTPTRIDNNELWIDIAIQPTKAVEFIYIPLRLVNTGEDMQALYNNQL